MIEAGLHAKLATLATTYPSFLPQERSLPALVYSRVSTARTQTHDGPTGLVAARIQITAHAATYAATLALVGQVVAALNGYSGPLGTVAVGNVEIVNEVDFGYRLETTSHQIAVDAIVHYQE